MNRGKKEACRNFIRGSCQYGDRCKFSHSSANTQPQQHQYQQQQQQSSRAINTNPFGFGTIAQHSKTPTTSANNQPKPFQNKWTRDTAGASTTFGHNKSNDQPHPPQPNHTCSSPEVCKRQMLEDFQNENPLWKLTCYGHFRHLPCDIVGDISHEELRAAAYDDVKKGLSLSAIIERERNMVNAKLFEFENLMRSPRVSQNGLTGNVSHFPSVTIAQSPTTFQNNTPPQSVSSFSQLGFTANQEFKTSSVAPSNSSFGQHSSFPASNHTSGIFGANNLDSGARGLFGKQQNMPSQGSTSTVNIPFGFGSNPTTPSSNSMQPANVTSNQAFDFSLQRNGVGGLGQQTYVENSQGVHGDKSIWLKNKWNPGEIPEEAPPSEVCM